MEITFRFRICDFPNHNNIVKCVNCGTFIERNFFRRVVQDGVVAFAMQCWECRELICYTKKEK